VFVRNYHHEACSKAAACLELYSGVKGAVLLKAGAALFKLFGSAAFYELQVVYMGETPQWGFCTEDFVQLNGHSDNGVGDNDSSWGVDGDRLLKFYNGDFALGGCRWQDGDVIGLACDLRTERGVSKEVQMNASDICAESAGGGSIWVSLNGDFSPPYGLVFYLPQGISGLFAAFTSATGAVRCNLGEESFKYAPPGEGFMPMCSFLKLR
jgi:hypothetical protein